MMATITGGTSTEGLRMGALGHSYIAVTIGPQNESDHGDESKPTFGSETQNTGSRGLTMQSRCQDSSPHHLCSFRTNSQASLLHITQMSSFTNNLEHASKALARSLPNSAINK